MKLLIRLFLLTLAGILLGACARGPDQQQLADILESRLNDRFFPGLLSIKEIDRRGHQPYTTTDGQPGVIIYYKAVLEFNRQEKLTGWDKNAAGSLVSVLGATPAGIQGINPNGNQANDELTVFGLLSFRSQDDNWFSTEDVGYTESTRIASESAKFRSEDEIAEERYFSEQTWQQRLIRELTSTLNQFDRQGDIDASAEIKSNLRNALTRAKLQSAQNLGRPTLLSGSVGGNYHALGLGLEQLLKSHKTPQVDIISSSGAYENLELLREGLADFALTQSDLASFSYQGIGKFTGKQNSNLRFLSAIYPEALHIIVPRESEIHNIAQLSGKRINIGAVGSGGRVNALQLLESYALDVDSLSDLDFESALIAMKRKEIDALIFMTGFPTQSFAKLGEDYRLLSIDAEQIERMQQRGLSAQRIAAGSYPGQHKDIITLGVSSILVTHSGVADKLIKEVVELLTEGKLELIKHTPLAGYIDPSRAIEGFKLPPHAAVSGVFEE